MSDNSTVRLLNTYNQEAEAPMFFSGFFQSPPSNFFSSEKIEIDIVREDEDVAVVVQDLKAGGRQNEATKYVNKSFTPPVIKEEATISAFDMLKRVPGATTFDNPNVAANATAEAFSIMRKVDRKIRRAIELMCSQVFQTGAVTCVDETATALYTLDYLPKATHMATVSTTWATDGSAGDPLADMENLAEVIRQDGKREPTMAVYGKSAWQRWLANADVQKRFERVSGLGLGTLAPAKRGQGATFQGWVWLGNYRIEMWTYNGWYKSAAGDTTSYLDTDNVIMLAEGARYDLCFGDIPLLRAPTAPALTFMPRRFSDSATGMDLNLNAFFTESGEHLKLQMGTRVLPIPTAIDTFARLNVTA